MTTPAAAPASAAARPLRVRLVTPWQTACGIAEHSAMLKDAVEAADPAIALTPETELDPHRLEIAPGTVLHLNYQAALHSRWTPAVIAARAAAGIPVVVTYHDTGVPNSDQCKGVIAAATAAVVHEPFDDLPADSTHYWRMGVPEYTKPYRRVLHDGCPVLGTVGFPFPWKNYDALCEITAAAGWALLLVAPGATDEDVARWQALQPRLTVCQDFVPQPLLVAMLSGCDATAFLYTCANAGQSGALLLGIAACQPVIALASCRQFRALYEDRRGKDAILWVESLAQAETMLRRLDQQRTRYDLPPAALALPDLPTQRLAAQESWRPLGEKYAALYRAVAEAVA